MNTPIKAINHGNGTMTVLVETTEHIDYLRARGIAGEISIGPVLLTNSDRRKIYPTLTEAIEDSGCITRYLTVIA